jgi:hypothetical protein
VDEPTEEDEGEEEKEEEEETSRFCGTMLCVVILVELWCAS